jgi:hypothetical protein
MNDAKYIGMDIHCPLGQPEKAIGEKSPIEPWLAWHNPSACLRQELTGVVTKAR